jgi:hypothetical protein
MAITMPIPTTIRSPIGMTPIANSATPTTAATTIEVPDEAPIERQNANVIAAETIEVSASVELSTATGTIGISFSFGIVGSTATSLSIENAVCDIDGLTATSDASNNSGSRQFP